MTGIHTAPRSADRRIEQVKDTIVDRFGMELTGRGGPYVAGRVLAVMNGRVIREAPNIIMDVGLYLYAARICQGMGGTFTYDPGSGAQNPITDTFRYMQLGAAGNVPDATSDYSDITTKVTNGLKVNDTGYPKRNDDDPDNTGAGTAVLSWRTTYATSEGNHAAIDRVALTRQSPGATEQLLMYTTFAAFQKTTSDTLKMFINHTFQNP